jgi:hypothetical protein
VTFKVASKPCPGPAPSNIDAEKPSVVRGHRDPNLCGRKAANEVGPEGSKDKELSRAAREQLALYTHGGWLFMHGSWAKGVA